MKKMLAKMLVLIIFLLAVAMFSSVSAQTTAPPGAGDRDLRDTNVKGRSNELERIDREARKADNNKTSKSAKVKNEKESEDRLAAKYEEIKTDFEQIQQSQNSIVSTYTTGEKIDYGQIGKFAMEINKSAIRLNSNLFPPAEEKSDAKKEEKTESKTTKSVKELIVDLDNNIGSFAASPMFQNLRVVDSKVAEKAQLDLAQIIALSAALNQESLKMTSDKK